MNIYFDFGSNSLKAVIYEIESETLSIIDELYFPNRFGAFNNEQKYISVKQVELTIEYLNSFHKKYNIEKIHASGTEVFRIAVNTEQTIELIERETDICINVLSADEEAKLIYNVNSLVQKSKDFLLVDSGGMSTELVSADCFQSVDLGAVNLTEKFELNKPTGRATINSAILHVLSKIDLSKLCSRYSNLVLTGGSAGIMNNITGNSSISLLQLNKFIREFSMLDLQTRKEFKGVPSDRADIILGGALIIKAVMKVTGIMDAEISSLGLRHGMLHKIHPDAVKFIDSRTGMTYSLI